MRMTRFLGRADDTPTSANKKKTKTLQSRSKRMASETMASSMKSNVNKETVRSAGS